MADNFEDGEDKEHRLLQTLWRHLAEDSPNPKDDRLPFTRRAESRSARSYQGGSLLAPTPHDLFGLLFSIRKNAKAR